MPKVLVSTKDISHQEWLEWRNKGVGGSDCACACGLNPYKSPVELWLEKTEQSVMKEENEKMHFGKLLEPIIKSEFEKRTGFKVKSKNAILQHSKHDFMLANIDGYISSESGTAVFEAKTTSEYNLCQWENGIPEYYQLQLQHYMTVTGYPTAYIAVLIGGNKYLYHQLNFDKEISEMIIKIEHDFWRCVTEHRQPVIDGTQTSTELLNKLYPASNKKEIVLPDTALKYVEQYSSASQKEKEAIFLKNEAANKLKDMIKDYETGRVADKIITWKQIISSRLDSKKIQSELPEIFNKYQTENTYRRFAIK